MEIVILERSKLSQELQCSLIWCEIDLNEKIKYRRGGKKCMCFFQVCCFAIVQLLIFTTPWTAACQAHPSSHVSWSLLKFMSIEWVTISNHLILCCPLPVPSIFPSIRVFSSESALRIRWPKCLNFSLSLSPPNEYSELICLSIDWFDLLAVLGTLKSLLQHQNSKALILWCPAFYMVQLSYPYMTIYSNLFELNCVKISSK